MKKVKAEAIPEIWKVLTDGVIPEMWRKFQTEFVKNHEPAIVNQVVARLKSYASCNSTWSMLLHSIHVMYALFACDESPLVHP